MQEYELSASDEVLLREACASECLVEALGGVVGAQGSMLDHKIYPAATEARLAKALQQQNSVNSKGTPILLVTRGTRVDLAVHTASGRLNESETSERNDAEHQTCYWRNQIC